jgi:hypothetical protein
MAQLVLPLYKLEEHGFNSQFNWNLSLIQFFQPHCGPGIKFASNRNEYEEYFLGCKGSGCIGLMTLPPSCVDCLEIWSLNLTEPSRPVQGLLYLYLVWNYKLLK